MNKRNGLILVLLLVVGGFGLEFYTRGVDQFTVTNLDLPEATQKLVMIFHGSKDADNPVFTEIAELSRLNAGPHTRVINYNWSFGSDNRLRASANARRLGVMLADELAQLPQLQQIIVIAHSSGAYVPDALCSRVRELTDKSLQFRTVYLDPFGLQGLLNSNHGAEQHGHCADFALAIINTEDPAPATDQPLSRAFNIDITAHPGRAEIQRNAHYWPPRYFADRLRNKSLSIDAMNHQLYPRGEIFFDSET